MKLHPVSAVAEMWECSDDHIYRLIAAGEIEITDIGCGRAKIRISDEALKKYIATRTKRTSRRVKTLSAA